MIRIVGVRFRSAGKVYYFDPKDLQVRMGDHVIAETSKGPEYGIISTCMKMVDEELVQQPLRSLVRLATEEDEQRIDMLRVREKEALRVCREKVREHELEMKMVDAEYSFDGSKVLFYFTADGRVDFRSLVKDLASVFHVRIELRQIGVRDETRMLGGIGICGRELCCATYLRDFQPVSIKMAKEQNLSLNPTKISGTCGRLMCCLKNEEATYEYLNARMPKLGEEAITADGQSGKVIELDVLRQRVRVLFEDEDTKEIEVFPVDALTFRPKKKKDPSQQGKKARSEKGSAAEKDGAGKQENAPRADRQGRAERAEKPEKGERPPKREKSERAEREDRSERPDRAQRDERSEKPERAQREDLGERPERAEGEDRSERPERTEGADRGERPDRAQRDERSERPDRTEREGRGERPDRTQKEGRGERPERAQKEGRSEKPERAQKEGRGERPERAQREDRAEKEGGENAGRTEKRRPRRRKHSRPDAGYGGKDASGKARNEEGSGKPYNEDGQGSSGKGRPRAEGSSAGGEEKAGAKKHRRYRPRPKPQADAGGKEQG